MNRESLIDALSSTEVQVLIAIDNEGGWYGQGWFPTVDRDGLNFPNGPSDAEIHAALLALIRSGHLECHRWVGADLVRVNDEVLAEVRKPSTETDFTLTIKEGVMAEIEARERARWIEIRNTDLE